jgi:hypothetical protein
MTGREVLTAPVGPRGVWPGGSGATHEHPKRAAVTSDFLAVSLWSITRNAACPGTRIEPSINVGITPEASDEHRRS